MSVQLSVTFLPFQIHKGFSFAIAAVVRAIQQKISGLDPSSDTPDPRYLKLLTVSSFSPLSAFDSIGVVGHPLGFHLHTVKFSGGSRNFKTGARSTLIIVSS